MVISFDLFCHNTFPFASFSLKQFSVSYKLLNDVTLSQQQCIFSYMGTMTHNIILNTLLFHDLWSFNEVLVNSGDRWRQNREALAVPGSLCSCGGC